MAERVNSIPGVQVGDRVWSEWYDCFGEVISIDPLSIYPIQVLFNDERCKPFTMDGYKIPGGRTPDLFFDKPEPIKIPPRPKKTEKKWCWIFGDGRFLSICPFFILRPMSELQAEEFRIEHKLDWKQRIDVTAQEISD